MTEPSTTVEVTLRSKIVTDRVSSVSHSEPLPTFSVYLEVQGKVQTSRNYIKVFNCIEDFVLKYVSRLRHRFRIVNILNLRLFYVF